MKKKFHKKILLTRSCKNRKSSEEAFTNLLRRVFLIKKTIYFYLSDVFVNITILRPKEQVSKRQ